MALPGVPEYMNVTATPKKLGRKTERNGTRAEVRLFSYRRCPVSDKGGRGGGRRPNSFYFFFLISSSRFRYSRRSHFDALCLRQRQSVIGRYFFADHSHNAGAASPLSPSFSLSPLEQRWIGYDFFSYFRFLLHHFLFKQGVSRKCAEPGRADH